MASISIVVPVLNEAANLRELLPALAGLLMPEDELWVVDGGSTDDSVLVARQWATGCVRTAPGRARQMNAGAAEARGHWLWFVHADCRPERAHLQALRAVSPDRPWGRFDVRLSGEGGLFRLIGGLINLRSRISGIATGDQGIFVQRQRFLALGGFADQPLMEDIALSLRLRKQRWPRCLRPRLQTSSRRWRQHGSWRTIWLMWRLRWRYWRGADPVALHREYYGEH
ncbi:hypothetical protein A11A3_13133 [Alcanivorax hongdengensis A-11-3]|uniref:Glycosyltransferase 2-like domain-containing protein n=1 Tax=Alcanivorax hongdengensis A-11-3 TaxID=1177179 RepID=L0W9B3_9GAMM|nr:TIGR04283 family arsenosugar biosynthesis glycosyltransferase [Alcanivorax hongdengensis]EKF73574.1 hypothetical protein A11A3_13133 [Alcanivorax hongdengensis A-11-3]